MQALAIPFMADTRKASDCGQKTNDLKSDSNCVRVNILDPAGGHSVADELLDDYHLLNYNIYRVEEWEIGVNISREEYEKYVDSITKELYMLTAYQTGKAKCCFLNRNIWQQAYEQMKML